MMTKYIRSTLGPRFVAPSTLISYSRSLMSDKKSLYNLKKFETIRYCSKLSLIHIALLWELKSSPVFYITYICKVNRCINTNNYNPVVSVCFWVLLDISVNSGARKTSQYSWNEQHNAIRSITMESITEPWIHIK